MLRNLSIDIVAFLVIGTLSPFMLLSKLGQACKEFWLDVREEWGSRQKYKTKSKGGS